MSKDERERRAKKKRKEDPNPNRKGKAKMVTDIYSNWRNELQLDEGMGLGIAAGAAALAAPYLAKKILENQKQIKHFNVEETNFILREILLVLEQEVLINNHMNQKVKL